MSYIVRVFDGQAAVHAGPFSLGRRANDTAARVKRELARRKVRAAVTVTSLEAGSESARVLVDLLVDRSAAEDRRREESRLAAGAA